MNATVYDGLKRYGFDGTAADLATKSTHLWLSTWEDLGWFPEYWDPEPGQVIQGAATDTAYRTYCWSQPHAADGHPGAYCGRAVG